MVSLLFHPWKLAKPWYSLFSFNSGGDLKSPPELSMQALKGFALDVRFDSAGFDSAQPPATGSGLHGVALERPYHS
jgi:hypothetical protein